MNTLGQNVGTNIHSSQRDKYYWNILSVKDIWLLEICKYLIPTADSLLSDIFRSISFSKYIFILQRIYITSRLTNNDENI